LDLDPESGTELERLAKEVMGSSPEVIERVQKLLSGGK
jgi:hypothetical protein